MQSVPAFLMLINYPSRLLRFAKYSKPKAHTYALDKFPSDCHWGNRGTHGRDYSKLICMPGRRSAVNVWCVGRVTHSYFFDRENKPYRHVSLNVIPLTIGTLRRTQDLLSRLSRSTTGPGKALYLSRNF